MGLISVFIRSPSPGGATGTTGSSVNIPDDRLRAGMDMNDLDDLLAAPLQLGQGFRLQRERPRQLHAHVSRTLELQDLFGPKRATTFFAVFPYATVWANNVNGQGYDIVLVGHLEPPIFNLDDLQARLDRPGYAAVAKSLQNVNLGSVTDLFSTYAGNSAVLQPWLKDAAINHDADLRLQYLAGLALNHAEEDSIYRQIMQYWAPPVGLFAGSPQRMDTLFSAMTTRPEGQESGPVKSPAVKPIAD